jgi:prepilin signal peptidase PulO-like enzyme (type II secretory pathway)
MQIGYGMEVEILQTYTPYIAGILFSIIMGLGFGSYATMAVYRLPRGMNWMGKKTRCISCDHVLVLRDFMPILSWYLTKGKCRYCNNPIETRLLYLMIEILLVVFCVLSFIRFGYSENYIITIGMAMTATILGSTDIEQRQLPNKSLIVLLLFALVYRVPIDSEIYNIIDAGAICLLIGLGIRTAYYTIIGRKDIARDYTEYKSEDKFGGEAFQYIKLLFICGVCVGMEQLHLFLAFTFVFTMLMIALQEKFIKNGMMPFSLPMLLGLAVVIYFPL